MHVLTFLAAGIASWFNALHDYGLGDHFCAMNHVAVGTRVLVIDDENQRESECTVAGTGPFVAGRVIDVSPAVRDDLGMAHAGLARVRVYRVTDRPRTCRREPIPTRCSYRPPICVVSFPLQVVCSWPVGAR